MFDLLRSFQWTKRKKFTCILATRTVCTTVRNKISMLSVELKVKVQDFLIVRAYCFDDRYIIEKVGY